MYESSQYLFSKNLYEETKEVLRRISVFNLGYEINIVFENELKNKTNIEFSKFDGIENNQKANFFKEFLEIFKIEKIKLYIIIIPLIWFLDAFAFFAIYFMIKYIDNNIYLMNMILFISEAVSYIISNYLSNIYGKRDCMIYSFILSALSFILFYFLNPSTFFTLILVFSAKFGAAVILNISSIYTNECFPTIIRGRCTAICSFLGKFGGIISPILVETTNNTSIISSIFCFFAAAILIPLKNTNDKIEFEDKDLNILNNCENDNKFIEDSTNECNKNLEKKSSFQNMIVNEGNCFKNIEKDNHPLFYDKNNEHKNSKSKALLEIVKRDAKEFNLNIKGDIKKDFNRK